MLVTSSHHYFHNPLSCYYIFYSVVAQLYFLILYHLIFIPLVALNLLMTKEFLTG